MWLQSKSRFSKRTTEFNGTHKCVRVHTHMHTNTHTRTGHERMTGTWKEELQSEKEGDTGEENRRQNEKYN